MKGDIPRGYSAEGLNITRSGSTVMDPCIEVCRCTWPSTRTITKLLSINRSEIRMYWVKRTYNRCVWGAKGWLRSSHPLRSKAACYASLAADKVNTPMSTYILNWGVLMHSKCRGTSFWRSSTLLPISILVPPNLYTTYNLVVHSFGWISRVSWITARSTRPEPTPAYVT